jgi:nicotinamide-nucleotide amidase
LKLAYLPKYVIVLLRITGWSTSNDQLEKDLNTEFTKLKILVQEWLVTDEDNTLPMALSKLLRAKNKTMATAESCTGGYIAHLITAIPGASNIYKGSIISYDKEIKI